jgi:DNA-directed RNA polymerase I subunit RPA43
MTRVAVLAAASVYQPSEVRKKSNLKFVQETPLENCSTDMSIEKAAEPLAPRMGSEKHRSKSEKRHKSAHGEKKRKRDHGEEAHKSRSKKHKSDKAASQTSSLDITAPASPFHAQTVSLYLPLAPVSQKHPLEGLCAEHISPLILTYYPPLNGVVLSYSNPRLAEKPFKDDGASVLLQNIDEYAVSWAWVTAEFLLFKPDKGALLEGYINLQNQGHLGIVCWNLFNASIESKRLPSDWKWKDVSEMKSGKDAKQGETYAEEGPGFWIDGKGNKIEGMVKFRVREIESSHDRERGFLSIEGTMLNEEEEEKLIQMERDGAQNARDTAGRRLGGSRALGATSLGVIVEPEMMDVDTNATKHKQKT